MKGFNITANSEKLQSFYVNYLKIHINKYLQFIPKNNMYLLDNLKDLCKEIRKLLKSNYKY